MRNLVMDHKMQYFSQILFQFQDKISMVAAGISETSVYTILHGYTTQ
jgi:hypothetical protein